jgi:Tetratricopeptide repeat/NB-ARC domain
VLAAGGIPRPADVVIAAVMHNLPRPPTAVFVGREDVLARLEEGLAGGDSVVVTQAVFGLGGVGKSELALQYAHAHRYHYELTWWVTAEERSQVESGLAEMAGRICPEPALAATTSEAATWVLTWLQAHPGWLLVLDDVSDPRDVEPLPLEERALAVTEAALGPDHPDTAWCRNNLAASYRAAGRTVDAAALEGVASETDREPPVEIGSYLTSQSLPCAAARHGSPLDGG